MVFQRNRFAKSYYDTFIHLLKDARQKDIRIDIIGHFDIISNYCKKYHIFDENCKAYQSIALDALHAVIKDVKIFEVNTSALPSNRDFPNPAPFLLKELKMLGGSVLITSDCHDKKYLQHGFDIVLEVIQACGFDEILILSDKGFQGIKI